MQEKTEYEQTLQSKYSQIIKEITEAKRFLSHEKNLALTQVTRTQQGQQEAQNVVITNVQRSSDSSEKPFFDSKYYENLDQNSNSSQLIQTQIIMSQGQVALLLMALDSAGKFIQNNFEKQVDSAIKSNSEERLGQNQVNFLAKVKSLVQQINKNQHNVELAIQNIEKQMKKSITELEQVEKKQSENIEIFIEEIKKLQVYPEFDSNVAYKERIEKLQKEHPIYRKRLFVSIFKKIDALERQIDKINQNKQNEKSTNKIAQAFTSDEYTNELKEIICQMEYCKIYLRKYEELSETISSLK